MNAPTMAISLISPPPLPSFSKDIRTGPAKIQREPSAQGDTKQGVHHADGRDHNGTDQGHDSCPVSSPHQGIIVCDRSVPVMTIKAESPHIHRLPR